MKYEGQIMNKLSLPDIFWQLIGNEEEDFEIEDNLTENIWTTADGETIHVSKMSDRHLLNTIALVDKSSDWGKVLCKELAKRIIPSVAKINIEEKEVNY